jgi:hypothetical protein
MIPKNTSNQKLQIKNQFQVAFSTALPLNVGGLLAGNTLTGLINTIDSTLGDLLAAVDDVVKVRNC